MGNYLVISEGKRPEEKILEFLFGKLGYQFLSCANDFDFSGRFSDYFDSTYDIGTQVENRVYFLHLKNPRVNRLYSDLKKSNVLPLPDLVSKRPFFFEATFLLHDVDHYYSKVLKDIGALCNQPEIG